MIAAGFQMWVTFAVILAGVAMMASERVRLEVTCAGIIVAFLLFFHFFPVIEDGESIVTPERLLLGFANPALLTILALLVIGQGLFQTGALDGPTRMIAANAGKRPALVIPVVLLVAAIISAFMNNTPVVVMFLPVLSAVAGRLRMSASKVLMPLSFIAILGGMTTLIGSSTNLLVADVAVNVGLPRLGFFDITVMGSMLAAVGALYVFFVMPHLLAPRATMAEEVTGGGGKQFIAQIQVTPDHPLVGVRSVSGMFPDLKNMTVRLIQRGEHQILPPFDETVLQPGDTIIVAATRQVLTDSLKARENILAASPPHARAPEEPPPQRGDQQLTLAEAVIAPGSRMIGRTVEQSGLHAETSCIVLGIQRRSRMIRMRLTDIRLEAGDVILVLGDRDAVEGLRLNRDLLLLEWSAAELPRTERANVSLGIFAVVVLAAATGILPIVVAAIAGSFAMVASGCLNVRQASRAFDRQIYLLIAAALAMALPLEATGGAAFLANSVVGAFEGASPAVVLSAIFALVAVLTNVLSNNATAVLFTPIAVSAAERLGVDPMIFVVAVIFAANCSFASPIGYQTNLLVMGPGHYRFSDFLRAGAPLVFIIWGVFTVLAPWYYGL